MRFEEILDSYIFYLRSGPADLDNGYIRSVYRIYCEYLSPKKTITFCGGDYIKYGK